MTAVMEGALEVTGQGFVAAASAPVADCGADVCDTAAGGPFRLVAAPVQFGEEAPAPARAPECNEHGDAILAALGLDWDAIVDLEVCEVVA